MISRVDDLQNIGICGVLFLLLVASCGGGALPRHANDFSTFDAYVTREMEAADVPGVSLAILRNGVVVHERAYGVANVRTGQPLTTSTLLEAASLSKPVFAFFVLLQVEKGLLDLDRPLEQYLPHPLLLDDPRLNNLTARHVLTHTSGLPNWRSDTGGELKFMFTPGEQYGYSGEGFEYLRMVVTHLLRTDDEGLQAHVDHDVTKSVGAKTLRFAWDEHLSTRKAYGHRDGMPTDNHKHDGNFGASYSLNTTPGDYARFLAFVMRPDGVWEAAARQLLRQQNRLPAELGEQHRSLGFAIKNTPRGLRYYHSGSNGDFRAYCHFYPETGDGIVIFGNSDRLFSSNLAQRIVAYFNEPWFHV